MALKLWRTGPRHWYYCVLVLLCVAWWNAIDYISSQPGLTRPADWPTRPPIKSDNPLYPSNLKLINITDFRYVINNPCHHGRRRPFPFETEDHNAMAVVVTSNARDFELRASQREAFPSSELSASGIRRVFLLAKDDTVDARKIAAENEANRDIVQGDFAEHYRHLSYKHIMGLQWAVNYCENARYIVKMDDDIMVDYYQLLAKLSSDYKSLDNVALGYKQFGLAPQRNAKSKWFVSRSEFSGDTYPDFLSGWAWATSPATAAKLIELSGLEKFFWIDDLWVTGILTRKSGDIAIESLNTFYTVYAEHIECCVDPAETNKLCDFIVGPSLDRTDLITRFGRAANRCHRSGRCERRKWEDSVLKTCVKIDNPFFLPPNAPGVGEVIVVPNKLL